MTPLEALAKTLTATGMNAIFKNQAIMYQTLVLFSGNRLNAAYGTETTDELINDIKLYIYNRYSQISVAKYKEMHRCICSNITGFPVMIEMDDMQGKAGYLTSVDTTNLKANINKVIHGKRNLSHSWIMEWRRNKDHIEAILYRIFWMLQYYCVYYGKPEDTIKNKEVNPAMDCAEFYSLSLNKRRALLGEIKKNCLPYSDLLGNMTVEFLNFYSLSRIILDILVAHIKYYNQEDAANIPKIITTNTRDTLSLEEQLKEFQKYVLCYSRKTINYYNMLEKYAPTNCYAATELGNLYFYGEELLCGDRNNNYVLYPDHKKAIKYFLMAIKHSSPPYPVACWWIGHIIKEGFWPGEQDIQKAKYYFEFAKDYTPTFNSLAQLEIREADELYNQYLSRSTTATFSEVVNKYVHAIELAGKAADNNWLFANNVIARFIANHAEDTVLLTAIKENVQLTIPFDYETQLFCSCESDNPWALHELSLYYIKTQQKEKALPLLERARALNYNRAFYTLAMNYKEAEEKEAMLKQASSLLYPPASYELALMYSMSQQYALARSYIMRAEQQNIALRKMNKPLQEKILELKKILL